MALHVELCASVIPVRLLLLPVVFPALRVNLFQQQSFQRATFFIDWQHCLGVRGAWETDHWP